MILYFHTGLSSFVDSDLKIFQGTSETRMWSFTSSNKIFTPFLFIRQFFFLLKNIYKTQLVICQFAGYHSFLPLLFAKLTGKKSLIISGGTDCVSFPRIGYGNFYKGLLSIFTKWSFQLADHLAPKHATLLKHQYTYDTSEPKEQGILAFLPHLRKPTTVIFNGYDADKWKATADKTKNSFITICGGWQFPFQEQLKGIDLILEVAVEFPQCTFAIAGVPQWKILDIQSENIVILPPISNNLLAATFGRYEYYLQLSMAEGFPNALCEAMLCECIPVVSDVFSMPEIIGNSGFVLKKRDVNELNSLIQQIITSPVTNMGSAARKRIADNYSLDRRKNELTALVKRLLN